MNPDRKKKIKRIIAREGLIFLVLFIPGAMLFGNQKPSASFFFYAIYLLIRFIVWAIKTLRGR